MRRLLFHAHTFSHAASIFALSRSTDSFPASAKLRLQHTSARRTAATIAGDAPPPLLRTPVSSVLREVNKQTRWCNRPLQQIAKQLNTITPDLRGFLQSSVLPETHTSHPRVRPYP